MVIGAISADWWHRPMHRTRLEAQLALTRLPRAYVAMLRLKHRSHRFKNRVVAPNTCLVLEAYPRSGSSFAVQAFKMAQAPKEPKVATHSHSPAQVVVGVRLGLPCLVLIRHPRECVVSERALRQQIIRTSAEPVYRVSIGYDLRRYTNFYGLIERVGGSVAVARFEDVIADFGLVTRRVNERFGTDFVEFEHTTENVERIFSGNGQHLSPSAERDEIKAAVLDEYRDPRYQRSVERAELIYERLVARL